MSGFQQITLVGNAGQDAEIKYLRDGTAVATFSLAVNKVTGRGEQRKQRTTWMRITVWRDYAETISKYVKVGMKLLVVGEVDVAAYTDKKTGEARASLEVTASTVTFLDRKPETGTEAETAAESDETTDIPF
ncbi:MAG: single-stranded DNA-binding protein [Aggregatilineales bacterium]